MLIDRSHAGWAGASVLAGVGAMGLFILADRRLPGGLTGGSVAGMWFGIAGFGLFVYAASLSILRRLPDRVAPGWWKSALAAGAAAAILFGVAILSGRLFVVNDRARVALWAGIGVLGLLVVARLLRYGTRSTWLKGHIWLGGALSAWLIALHSRFRLGGSLEQALWVLLALTLLTGVYGLVLQQVVPRLLTARFAEEVPAGQIEHVCGLLRHEADELVEALRPPTAETSHGARARETSCGHYTRRGGASSSPYRSGAAPRWLARARPKLSSRHCEDSRGARTIERRSSGSPRCSRPGGGSVLRSVCTGDCIPGCWFTSRSPRRSWRWRRFTLWCPSGTS